MFSQRGRQVLTRGAVRLLILGVVLRPFALLLPRVEPGAAAVEGPPITLPAPGFLGSSRAALDTRPTPHPRVTRL